MMFKKESFLLITLILYSLISCSNNQSAIITYENENTLKTQIMTKGDEILWTKELEGNVLTQDIKKNSLVVNNTLSPYAINVLTNQFEEIYPEYEGFGSLDIRNIPDDVKDFVNSFCSQLSKNIYAPIQDYVSKDFYFSYIFFINDLKDGWKKNFKTDFPEIIEEDVSENNEDNKNITANNRLFKNYVLGQPFNSDNYIQIPVRFFSSSGYFDAIIYMNNIKPYYIYNIEIVRWENKNAK